MAGAHSGIGRVRYGSILVAVALACAAFSNAAVADEGQNGAAPKGLFDSKYNIAVGGYFSRVNSDVRLEGPGGGGTTIDIEDDLGLDRYSSSAWVGFNWRFAPRHQFHAEWFQLNRTGLTSIAADLEIGGSTFTAGVALDTKWDLNIGRLSYAWSFLQDENNDLAFVVGAHIATTKITFIGTGAIAVDGMPIANTTHTESSSTFTFPLPHLGFTYSRRLSPRWTLQANALGFGLDTGSWGGYLIELNAAAGYQISENFGLGAGLKYYNVNVTSRSSSGDTRFDMWFLGPAIFGYATF